MSSPSSFARLFAFVLFIIPILQTAQALGLSPVEKVALLKRQACTDAEAQCANSVSDCANYICSSCTGIDPTIDQCCTLTDIDSVVACLAEDLNLGSAATSAFATSAITTAPPTSITDDPNFMACSSLDSISEFCESQTPGFTDADFTSQVPCLCYDSQTYDGSYYDDYYGSCLSYISTADPADFSSLEASADRSLPGPCAGAVNTQGAGPTTGAFKSTPTVGAGVGFASHSPSPASTPRPAIGNTTPTASSNSGTGGNFGGNSGRTSTGGQGKIAVRHDDVTFSGSKLIELDRQVQYYCSHGSS